MQLRRTLLTLRFQNIQDSIFTKIKKGSSHKSDTYRIEFSLYVTIVKMEGVGHV